MKTLMVICLAVFCCGLVGGQTPLPNQHTATPEEMIRSIIETGMLEGSDQKQIGKMADAAAVTVTKVLGDRELTTMDIQMALVIIRSSFADPRGVPIETDRQPRTTLLLLRYLDFWTRDPAIKQDIESTRKRVEEQYQKSLLPKNES